MRIMTLSNSEWSPSGYGQQMRMLLPRFQAAGHTVAITAFYGLQGGILNLNNILHYPGRFHPYGNDVIVTHSAHFGAQVMISWMDTWVMNPEEYPPGFHWVPWVPVDHDPMPMIVRGKIQQAWKRIACSKFGRDQIMKAGLDCYYVPCGLEIDVFRPGDKAEARKIIGVPEDRYLVGTVAMNKGNPSRKNLVEQMTAFKMFHDKHPEAMYLVQSERGEAMNDVINLPELARNLGLVEGESVMFPNPYLNSIGFPPEYIANFYRALDVHLMVGAGEGFGIPVLESQACGCPTITGDWTAQSELIFGGRKVSKADSLPQYSALASYIFRPQPAAITALLEEEYQHPTPMVEPVKAIQAEYDINVVVRDGWLPVLAELEGLMQPAPAPVPMAMEMAQ
jgi:glycosyltransferase involved in cell wall biosynthesis